MAIKLMSIKLAHIMRNSKNPSLREDKCKIYPSMRDVFYEISPSLRDFSCRNNAMRIICCNFAPENEEI